MTTHVSYYAGGYNPASPANNARETWDVDARTYTAFDTNGQQTAQRPFTTAENARADSDIASAQAQTNGNTLRQQATGALTGNQTYLGIASPTNAQVVAQVRALTQQTNALIRLVVNQLDATT